MSLLHYLRKIQKINIFKRRHKKFNLIYDYISNEDE